MRTFREFCEAQLIGSDDAGPSLAMQKLANKMAAKQQAQVQQKDPMLSSAVNKVRTVYQNALKSPLGSLKLKIGDNVLPNGKYDLIQRWGLTNDEVAALSRAGLFRVDSVGNSLLLIKPF